MPPWQIGLIYMKSFVSLIFLKLKSSLLLTYLVTQSLTLWIKEMLTHLKRVSPLLNIFDNSLLDGGRGRRDVALIVSESQILPLGSSGMILTPFWFLTKACHNIIWTFC